MRFADPQVNIERFRLEIGMAVADIGAGSGAYTRAAAHAVGKRGVVYAIDVQQELLRRIQNDAKREGYDNIEVLWGDVEAPCGTTLPDESVHAVILSNTLFLIDNKSAAVDEIFRILKKNGRVLIIDWKDSFNGLGPESSRIVSESDAKEMFVEKGFIVDGGIQAGSHHYGVICKKV